MLYASRLPAVFELATLCAKVLITERSSEAGRARMIGYNGVALGVGFVVSPLMYRACVCVLGKQVGFTVHMLSLLGCDW